MAIHQYMYTVLLLALLANGCGSSPAAPSTPSATLPLALSGQSNAEGLAPYLQAAYGPIVGDWASGLSIAFWSPTDRMWPPLAAALHQPLQAFVWWQGESDGGGRTAPADYARQLAALMTRVRQEAQNPTLRVLLVRIAPDPAFMDIRAAQEAWVAADAHATVISSDDLPLVPGEVHLTAAGYQQMAQRITALVR